MAACLMSLSAFSVAFAAEGVPFETEGTPVENADMANALKETAAQLLMFSEEELLIQKAVMENAEGDAMTAMVDAILEAKKEYGAIKDMDYAAAQAVEVEDGTITVSIPMTFEEGQVSYLMNVHPMTGETKIAFVSGTGEEENTTLAEQMKEGGIYSAFGLGTVFAVLIVISLVIAAFKLIGNTQTGKKEEAAPAPAAPAGAAGSVKITAPMPGKVVKVNASVGQAVKKGEAVLVLEAMKMENDIVAPQDGTIASINVSNGDAVESGAVLATMN